MGMHIGHGDAEVAADADEDKADDDKEGGAKKKKRKAVTASGDDAPLIISQRGGGLYKLNRFDPPHSLKPSGFNP